jgi:hypothetical protein
MQARWWKSAFLSTYNYRLFILRPMLRQKITAISCFEKASKVKPKKAADMLSMMNLGL